MLQAAVTLEVQEAGEAIGLLVEEARAVLPQQAQQLKTDSEVV